MRPSLLTGLVREERRVNAAKDHPRPTRASHLANRIAAQRIPSMNADAHDIAASNVERVNRIQCLIDDVGVTPPLTVAQAIGVLLCLAAVALIASGAN